MHTRLLCYQQLPALGLLSGSTLSEQNLPDLSCCEIHAVCLVLSPLCMLQTLNGTSVRSLINVATSLLMCLHAGPLAGLVCSSLTAY